MLRKILQGFCQNNQYCEYITDYKGCPAIRIRRNKQKYANNILLLFFNFMHSCGAADPTMIIKYMHVDTGEDEEGKYLTAYFEEDDVKEESVIDDSINIMAQNILNVINFDNWRYPWMARIVEIALRYVATDDSLAMVMEHDRIVDEMVEAIEDFNKEQRW